MTAYLGGGGGINWTIVILQFIAFGVVVAILWKFVITKVFVGMTKREESIRVKFSEIEAKQAEVEQQVREYDRKLHEIEQEAAGKMKAAVTEGLRLKAEMEAEAKRRAEDEIARTKTLIEIESDQAKVSLRREATRLAMEQAERLLAQAMTPDLQNRLVERYLQEMERVKQV